MFSIQSNSLSISSVKVFNRELTTRIPGSFRSFRSFAALLGPSRKRGGEAEEEAAAAAAAAAAAETAAMATPTKGRPILFSMLLLFLGARRRLASGERLKAKAEFERDACMLIEGAEMYKQ